MKQNTDNAEISILIESNKNYDISKKSIKKVIDFAINILKSDVWLKNFNLTELEHLQLFDFLQNQIYLRKIDPETNDGFMDISLICFKYIKQFPSYENIRDFSNETILKIQESSKTTCLGPSDCLALQDWPNNRLAVKGSGRLENAGQFMKRLLAQKLYDKDIYGELYLSDLRTINSKLYLALSQWQTRTGEIILGKKKDELKDLADYAKHSRPTLSLSDRSRLSSALWRHKKKTMSV